MRQAGCAGDESGNGLRAAQSNSGPLLAVEAGRELRARWCETGCSTTQREGGGSRIQAERGREGESQSPASVDREQIGHSWAEPIVRDRCQLQCACRGHSRRQLACTDIRMSACRNLSGRTIQCCRAMESKAKGRAEQRPPTACSAHEMGPHIACMQTETRCRGRVLTSSEYFGRGSPLSRSLSLCSRCVAGQFKRERGHTDARVSGERTSATTAGRRRTGETTDVRSTTWVGDTG